MAFMRSRVQLPSAPPKIPLLYPYYKKQYSGSVASVLLDVIPNTFIGNPLSCYREGQSPVSISWLSLEELIYLSKMKEKDKHGEVLGEKKNKDNSRNCWKGDVNKKQSPIKTSTPSFTKDCQLSRCVTYSPYSLFC